MADEESDWFQQNAPKQESEDWFAKNAPTVATQQPSFTQKVISGIGEIGSAAQYAARTAMLDPTLLTEKAVPESVTRFMGTGLVPPSVIQPVTNLALTPLRAITQPFFGKEPVDTVGKAISQFVSEQTSPGNLAIIAGTAGLGGLESAAGRARFPKLADTIFGPKLAEVAGIAKPESAPVEAEVAAQEPVAPQEGSALEEIQRRSGADQQIAPVIDQPLITPEPVAQPVQEAVTPPTAAPLQETPVVPTTASVPVMITRQMESDLRARGLSQEQINALRPQEAHEILQQPTTGEPNAVQEQSAGEVLQRQPEETGTTGSERVGVEPSVQGQELTETGQAVAPQEQVAAIPKLGELANRYTKTGGTEARIVEDLFDRTNPDREASIAQEHDLNTVTKAEADSAAKEVQDFTQWHLKNVRKLPDIVTVYRAGPLTHDVVGVTLDRNVATRRGARQGDPAIAYQVPRSAILADIEALRPDAFAEKELLVHPEDLKPYETTKTEPNAVSTVSTGKIGTTEGIPEGFIEEGINQEHPDVASEIDRYSHSQESQGLTNALNHEDYQAYHKDLQRVLKRVYGDDPIAVTRVEGYEEGAHGKGVGEHVSVSTFPRWGEGAAKRGAKVIRGFVNREDVVAAGNEAEGELIIKKSGLQPAPVPAAEAAKPVITPADYAKHVPNQEWPWGAATESVPFDNVEVVNAGSKTGVGSKQGNWRVRLKNEGNVVIEQEFGGKGTGKQSATRFAKEMESRLKPTEAANVAPLPTKEVSGIQEPVSQTGAVETGEVIPPAAETPQLAVEPSPVSEPTETTTAQPLLKTEESIVTPETPAEPPTPTEPIAEQSKTVPTPAETHAINGGEDPIGIAERYREEQQPGSVIPGIGRTADEARAWGHDFINKGGNPYDVVSNKGTKRELWQDVGVVRAEYERLSNEKRAAESALESNPNDPQARMAFENADLAQRQWSKDAQPVLTRAGDALRAASRSYPREINSFSDFTDIVNDHFKGEVELTPEKRAELQKAVKAIKKGNAEATEARAQVTNEAVKKAGGKVMSFDDLKTSLTDKMTKLLENCQT